MSKLVIEVHADQKAALLKGIVLGPKVQVEVTPDQFKPETWKAIVSALSMNCTPPLLNFVEGSTVYIDEATPEAVARVVDARIEKAAADQAARIESGRKAAEEWLADPIQKTNRNDLLGTGPEGQPVKLDWEEWSLKTEPFGYYYRDLIPADWTERRNAVFPSAKAEVEAHNAPFLAERERLKAIVAEADAARAAKAKAEAEAKEDQLAAVRLASGYFEEETGSYNDRRYGNPWIASVSFPNGPKPVYDFNAGESSGKWGKAGLRRIACKPGDIIATGQKDLRRPDNSDNDMFVMTPTGHMRKVDRVEAFRLWQEARG